MKGMILAGGCLGIIGVLIRIFYIIPVIKRWLEDPTEFTSGSIINNLYISSLFILGLSILLIISYCKLKSIERNQPAPIEKKVEEG